VSADPSRILSTTLRLSAASLLCVLALGMAWSYSAGSAVLVRQAPVRLFVVAAALGLAATALRSRTPATQRLARTATAALGVAIALALGHGQGPVVLLLAVALILAAPPAWRGPRAPA